MTLNDFERRTVPSDLHDLAARARAALGRFTTYPGTALRLEFGGGGSAFVAASIETVDADGTGREVCVQKAARFDLAELQDDVDDRLGALARDALIQLFTHEVDEWLRRDGARCRSPHPDPTRRLQLHFPEVSAEQVARDTAKRNKNAELQKKAEAIGDEWLRAHGVEVETKQPTPQTNDAAKRILRAALTGASMDELRRLPELQLRSFFSLLARRLEEPGAPTPEEVQGLLELVTDHLWHPAR